MDFSIASLLFLANKYRILHFKKKLPEVPEYAEMPHNMMPLL